MTAADQNRFLKTAGENPEETAEKNSAPISSQQDTEFLSKDKAKL